MRQFRESDELSSLLEEWNHSSDVSCSLTLLFWFKAFAKHDEL
jgi:hypothetical protein